MNISGALNGYDRIRVEPFGTALDVQYRYISAWEIPPGRNRGMIGGGGVKPKISIRTVWNSNKIKLLVGRQFETLSGTPM